MMDAFLFKSKKGGVNHVALRIDRVPSLCGSAFYDSESVKAQRVGERMPLDKLIHAHTKLCSKCETIAVKEIEKDNEYYR